MSIDSALQEIKRRQAEIVRLQGKKQHEASRLASEQKRGAAAAAAAAKASNASIRQSRLREAERQGDASVALVARRCSDSSRRRQPLQPVQSIRSPADL